MMQRTETVDAAADAKESQRASGPIWVLTDGKIGDDVQCLAIAAALNRNFEKRVVAPRWPWSMLAPWGPADPREAPGVKGGPLEGAPPAVAIASGRRAIPSALALKRASKGATRIVIMKDPRLGRAAADVLWVPAHDQVEGANVVSTLTSPHGLAARIAEARGAPGAAIAALPSPMLGVVLGGPSGGARYGVEEGRALAARINAAGAAFASIAVTPSRRTPGEFFAALTAGLVHERVFVWDWRGENPYTDMLANAASLIVAADSHNMMSEALASPAGVYAWRPPGLAAKMGWFADRLEAAGAARRFTDSAPAFDRAPLDATPEIIAAIRARLAAGRPA